MRKLREMSVSEGVIVPDTEKRVELLNGGD
jgi:hypothetical protein